MSSSSTSNPLFSFLLGDEFLSNFSFVCWTVEVCGVRCRRAASSSWVYLFVSSVAVSLAGSATVALLLGRPSPLLSIPLWLHLAVFAALNFVPGLWEWLQRPLLRGLWSLGGTLSGTLSICHVVRTTLDGFPAVDPLVVFLLAGLQGAVAVQLDVLERRVVGGEKSLRHSSAGFQASLVVAALAYSQHPASPFPSLRLTGLVLDRATLPIAVFVVFSGPLAVLDLGGFVTGTLFAPVKSALHPFAAAARAAAGGGGAKAAASSVPPSTAEAAATQLREQKQPRDGTSATVPQRRRRASRADSSASK